MDMLLGIISPPLSNPKNKNQKQTNKMMGDPAIWTIFTISTAPHVTPNFLLLIHSADMQPNPDGV